MRMSVMIVVEIRMSCVSNDGSKIENICNDGNRNENVSYLLLQ